MHKHRIKKQIPPMSPIRPRHEKLPQVNLCLRQHTHKHTLTHTLTPFGSSTNPSSCRYLLLATCGYENGVAEPSLQVLGAGVKELFSDARIFVMHSDALEQIQDGVSILVEHGEAALSRLR